MTHIIWTNRLNYEDWKADLEAEHPELDEDERYELMYEINNEYLDDERMNLNRLLPNGIIVIADLGLWNGRYSGYSEIDDYTYGNGVSTPNLNDCLSGYGNGYHTWYVDERGDFCCDYVHHDGTNHYIYRMWKDDAYFTERESLKEKIYDGKATRKDVTRYTKRLGDYIAEAYGWKISQRGYGRKNTGKNTAKIKEVA